MSNLTKETMAAAHWYMVERYGDNWDAVNSREEEYETVARHMQCFIDRARMKWESFTREMISARLALRERMK